MRLTGTFLAALLAATVIGADSPTPVPEPPQVNVWPDPIQPDQRMPSQVAPVLTPNICYKVKVVKPSLMLASPKTLVKIDWEEVPSGQTIRDNDYYFDDPTHKTLKKFVGPCWICTVTPTGAGNVELILLPVGVKAEADIERRSIQVDTGNGPRPPPGPGPQPADPFTRSIQAAYDASTEPDKAASLAFLQSAYAAMAANIKPGMTVNRDAAQWLVAVVQAPGSGLNATQIQGVRRVLATDVLATMTGAPTLPLDKAKFTAELTKISNALAGVKP